MMARRWGRPSVPGTPDAHVVFELDVDADGWPPVASERVWAFDLGRSRYRIDNVPWFARNIAVGDIVRAVALDADSEPVFTELLEPSDHVTVRIICLRAGPLAGDLRRVVEAVTPFGVYAEGFERFAMVALDVPPTAQHAKMRALLERGVADGSWEYDEGRVTRAWRRLDRQQ